MVVKSMVSMSKIVIIIEEKVRGKEKEKAKVVVKEKEKEKESTEGRAIVLTLMPDRAKVVQLNCPEK